MKFIGFLEKAMKLDKESCEYFIFCNTIYYALSLTKYKHPNIVQRKLFLSKSKQQISRNNNFATDYALCMLESYYEILDNSNSNLYYADRCLSILNNYVEDGMYYRSLTIEDKSNFSALSETSLYSVIEKIKSEQRLNRGKKNKLDEIYEQQLIIALWDFDNKFVV